MNWLTDRMRDWSVGPSGPLQIMYGIDGRSELPETTLPHWRATAARARCGSATPPTDQLQLDIYGEMIDSVYLYNKYGAPIFSDDLGQPAPDRRLAVRELGPGRRGDLGDPRRPEGLHLLAADVLGRARALDPHEPRRAACPATSCAGWPSATASTTRSCRRAGATKRGAFVQHYGSEVLDASILLMPLVALHRAAATRAGCSTLDAIGDELVSDSLVYRYDVEASPDGLRGDEGTFSICSFWYVEALTRAGRRRRGPPRLREDAHLRQPPRALLRGDRARPASCWATSRRLSRTSR